MSQVVRGDGSSVLDAERVEIDREDDIQRMRYRCLNGHTRWEPTNSHIWCHSCASAAQNGADVEPEQWEIHDAKTGETVPWSAVELV